MKVAFSIKVFADVKTILNSYNVVLSNDEIDVLKLAELEKVELSTNAASFADNFFFTHKADCNLNFL